MLDLKSPHLEQQIRDVIQHELSRSTFATLIRQLQGRTQAGTVVQSMPAVAAGAVGNTTVAANFTIAPSLVIAQFTGGGTVYSSDQYVIATGNYTATGFQVIFRSAAAQAAGWTIGVNFIAVF